MPITLNGTTGIANATWTTGTRPSSPVAGQMGYNSTIASPEWWDANTSSWIRFSEVPVYTVQYLIVAGGGGGASNCGGGGAGGLLTGTSSSLSVGQA